MSTKASSRPSTLKVWMAASRPHTLTASIAPVLVSWAIVNHYSKHHQTISYTDDKFNLYSILFAAFACLIQLGTNLHNDYADFVKGADTDKRVGQARATQKGWLTPFQTAMGSTLCLVLAAMIGVLLTNMTVSQTMIQTLDWKVYQDPKAYMIFVTITSVFNAVCYTGGPYPLGYIGLGNLSIGYSGLGDVFVFLYFGLVATITVPFMYVVRINEEMDILQVVQNELFVTSLIVAIPVGFLATGIIAVNNLRDRMTDITVGKNTLAVKFGESFTRIEYVFLILASFVFVIPFSKMKLLGVSGERNYFMYIPLLAMHKARKDLKAMNFGGKDGAALNPHVGGTAKIQLLYCILFVLGLRLSR